jgi:hypothetical protein
MSKAKVNFQPCIIGHRAWFKNRMVALISKHGSVRYEIPENEINSLPVYVISAILIFAEDIARNDI